MICLIYALVVYVIMMMMVMIFGYPMRIHISRLDIAFILVYHSD